MKKKYGSLFEQFNQLLNHEDEQIHDWVEYEKDIKILQEKEGYKLVFVGTPKYGYFGYVFKNGKLVIIGEEDEGIQDKKIMNFFNVDIYGELKTNLYNTQTIGNKGHLFIKCDYEEFEPETYNGIKVMDFNSNNKILDHFNTGNIDKDLESVKEKYKGYIITYSSTIDHYYMDLDKEED